MHKIYFVNHCIRGTIGLICEIITSATSALLSQASVILPPPRCVILTEGQGYVNPMVELDTPMITKTIRHKHPACRLVGRIVHHLNS